MERKGSAVWKGAGPTGSGEVTTMSGALKGLPISARARFENPDGREGSDPEELIAAAHAGCFSMALAFQLSKAGFTADELRTSSTIDYQKKDIGWTFVGIKLVLEARIPGIDAQQFAELAQAAAKGCPVSRALSAVPIELSARLV